MRCSFDGSIGAQTRKRKSMVAAAVRVALGGRRAANSISSRRIYDGAGHVASRCVMAANTFRREAVAVAARVEAKSLAAGASSAAITIELSRCGKGLRGWRQKWPTSEQCGAQSCLRCFSPKATCKQAEEEEATINLNLCQTCAASAGRKLICSERSESAPAAAADH